MTKKILIGVSWLIAILFVIAIISERQPSKNPKTAKEQSPAAGRYEGCDIVFTSDLHNVGVGEQGSELYCIKKDGSNLRRITNNDYFEFHSDVSPTRQEIATVTLFSKGSDKKGELDKEAELVIWDFEGNIVRRLTSNTRPESVPHWSPDGEKIVFFAGEKIGDLNIYIIERNGTGEKKLTNGGVDVDPSFTQEGDIIFSRGKNIMIMDTNGNNLKSFIKLDIEPADPIFIDSNTISFESKVSDEGNYGLGDYDIFLINKDGTNLRDISNNSAAEAMPQPISGGYITFWSIKEGEAGTKIMVMDKNGNNKQSLIKKISNNQMPTGNN